jgi:hypothetical protein
MSNVLPLPTTRHPEEIVPVAAEPSAPRLVTPSHPMRLESIREVMLQTNLSANARLLFAVMASLANRFGECEATQQQLAELVEVTPRSIMRYMDKLERAGAIERLGARKLRTYYLASCDTGVTLSDTSCDNGDVSCDNRSTSCDTGVTYKGSVEGKNDTPVYIDRKEEEEREREEYARDTREARRDEAQPAEPDRPESEDAVVAFGETVKIDEETCRRFWLIYDLQGWKKASGRIITNWKSQLRLFWLDQLQRARERGASTGAGSRATTTATITLEQSWWLYPFQVARAKANEANDRDWQSWPCYTGPDGNLWFVEPKNASRVRERGLPAGFTPRQLSH